MNQEQLPHVAASKQLRKEIDDVIQNLRKGLVDRSSRERSLALTKLQEAAMWLGMDLKAINEIQPGVAPDPYPQSRNPESPVVEPTADGVKL